MRLLAYRQEGHRGAPLLLVHGDFSGGARTWSPLLRGLAPHRRLAAVDRRGFGSSPADRGPYTIAADAADLIGVLDRLQWEAVHLVGHSYGGLVTLEAARQALPRVLGLHLLEPPYLALHPPDEAADRLKSITSTFADLLEREGEEGAAACFLEALLGPETTRGLMAEPYWPVLAREARRFAAQQPPLDYPVEALTELAAMMEARPRRLPVHLYSGGISPAPLKRIARILAERLPGADLTLVPGAGHDLHRAGSFLEGRLLATTGEGSCR